MSYRVRCISQIVKLWPAVSDKLYIAHAHIYDLKSGNRTNPRFSTSSMISVLSRRKLKSAFFMTRKIYQCKILNDSNTIFSIISFCQLNEFVVVILSHQLQFCSSSLDVVAWEWSQRHGKFINSFNQRTKEKLYPEHRSNLLFVSCHDLTLH